MNYRNWTKSAVAAITLVIGSGVAWAAKTEVITDTTIVNGPLFDITANGKIDVVNFHEIGVGPYLLTKKNNLLTLKANWSGQVMNKSGKAFKVKLSPELIDFFDYGAVDYEQFEYSVSKTGKATFKMALRAPLP